MQPSPSTADTFVVTSPVSGWRARFWPLLALAAATIPVAGVFTL